MQVPAEDRIKRPQWLLLVIILSQFAVTSLWFAGNAVIDDLSRDWQLPPDALGMVTSAVQLGFIVGTLVFAFLSLPDRFSPRKIFLFSAFAGSLCNVAITLIPPSYGLLLLFRFLVGFFLAGLYPVGMKIAAGWYQQGLGKALGLLVGALVLGTAFPHLLQSLDTDWSWQIVIIAVSLLAASGGILLYVYVADGPYNRSGTPFNPKALVVIFRAKHFRASAFGYFGHMWELYAFLAFVPLFLTAHLNTNGHDEINISLWAFLIIAAGFIGCSGGGYLSQWIGSSRVASAQLAISGLCCLLSPLMFFAPTPLLLAFLLIWGMTVSGDSPQFSTLNAQNAPPDLVGSALTIANSIGVAITIASIALLGYLLPLIETQYLFVFLLPGPLFGLYSMWPLLHQT
ncbi:MAG: MFS transporter [Thiolinea sp.]